MMFGGDKSNLKSESVNLRITMVIKPAKNL